MQYFGVPKCPYCKKRVNFIRTWSLKRQGEYQCPRCGGISNIFLSPLIYVFALLAVFAGGAVYFFHKFVLDDISLSTAFQVLVPFGVFFLLSLFLVYLAKPVIKKVPKSAVGKKNRKKGREDRSLQEDPPAGRMFYDDQEYLPQIDYRTGPLPQMEDDADMKVVPSQPVPTGSRRELQKTSVVEMPPAYRPRSSQLRRESTGNPPAASSPVSENPVPSPRAETPGTARPAAPRQTARRAFTVDPNAVSAVPTSRPAGVSSVREPGSGTAAQGASQPAVSSGAMPVSNEDFFAKYNDPDYVERRLRELKQERGGQN